MNSPSFLKARALDQAPPGSSVRTCLLVLGMHRSGTSALTRVLNIAGAKLPASLMGVSKGNEVGHWESDALVQFHDQLLDDLGSTWRDWCALEIGRLPLKRRRDMKVEISNLLAAEFGDATLFVVKDPRICRFAPLFLEAVDEAGVVPHIVHIFRNPLEVAESLERRDGLSPTAAALLWLRHVLDSEAETRSRSRAIVSYASLLTDWRATFESITEALRVTWPYSADDIAGQVSQFLDASLRHHARMTEDVLLNPALRDWVGEAYSALLVLEQSPDSKAAMGILDAIRREFQHAAPILHRLNTEARRDWDTHLLHIKAEIIEAGAESERRAATLAERDEELSSLKAALAERDKQVAGLKTAVDQENAKAAELAAAFEERDKLVTELDAAVDKKNAETEHLAGALVELEEEGAALKAALNDAEKNAADAKSLAEQRHEQLECAMHEQSVLFEQAYLSRQEIIDHFRSSTSWKLTRPLRALKQNLSNSTFLPKRQEQLLKAKPVPNDDASIIRESGLFNDLYYLSLLRDDKIKEPIEHYLQYGQQQGLNPNPLFDSDFYTTLYAPHIGEGINPFVHYIQYGYNQGFDPSRLFQTTYYCESNPDVQDSGIMPLLHYLISGRVEGRMPINIDPSKLNALTLQMHRLDLTNPDSHQFNPDLYVALHPELIDTLGRDSQTLQAHYETVGRTEGRIASLAAFLEALGVPPEAVPINFDDSEYCEINTDLSGGLPDTFFHAIEHYLQHGIREKRKYSYSQCYIAASGPLAASSVPTTNLQYMQTVHKVACLVHVYYPEVWPKIYQYVRNLECVDCDVFVNITDAMWSEELHAQIRRDVPGVSIVISENRGRDVGGHLNCLAGINIDDYAAFFLVHTKKSRHFSEKHSEYWRNSLLEAILGSAETVAENLALMNSDPEVGIIGAAAWRHKCVGKNSEKYDHLLRKFGIEREHAACDYVSGTMMIVKPKILKRMCEVLSKEEFENADGKSADWLRDGQLEHAAERLFANVCKSLGYKIRWR